MGTKTVKYGFGMLMLVKAVMDEELFQLIDNNIYVGSFGDSEAVVDRDGKNVSVNHSYKPALSVGFARLDHPRLSSRSAVRSSKAANQLSCSPLPLFLPAVIAFDVETRLFLATPGTLCPCLAIFYMARFFAVIFIPFALQWLASALIDKAVVPAWTMHVCIRFNSLKLKCERPNLRSTAVHVHLKGLTRVHQSFNCVWKA